jgi:hypothetical protein
LEKLAQIDLAGYTASTFVSMDDDLLAGLKLTPLNWLISLGNVSMRADLLAGLKPPLQRNVQDRISPSQ